MTLVAMILVAMNLVAMNLVAMNLCHRRFWKMFCCTPLALASGGLLSGCHQSKPAPPTDPSSMIHDVPIFPGPKLAPLDASALSGGKVTHYFRGGSNPNDPAQEAMLQACRELPIQDATAKSAWVVIKCSYGELPVSALVVGDTVLISLHQFLRALRTGPMIPSDGVEVLWPNSPGSIKLTRKSKYAVVGNKSILLKYPAYWTERHDVVMTLSDLILVFHERDVRCGGGHTIHSAEVSYEPNPSKLYSH